MAGRLETARWYIEASAHADFADRDLDPARRKPRKRRGRHFEKVAVPSLTRHADMPLRNRGRRQPPVETVGRYGLAIDGDAFSKISQVRRGVPPGAEPADLSRIDHAVTDPLPLVRRHEPTRRRVRDDRGRPPAPECCRGELDPELLEAEEILVESMDKLAGPAPFLAERRRMCWRRSARRSVRSHEGQRAGDDGLHSRRSTIMSSCLSTETPSAESPGKLRRIVCSMTRCPAKPIWAWAPQFNRQAWRSSPSHAGGRIGQHGDVRRRARFEARERPGDLCHLHERQRALLIRAPPSSRR